MKHPGESSCISPCSIKFTVSLGIGSYYQALNGKRESRGWIETQEVEVRDSEFEGLVRNHRIKQASGCQLRRKDSWLCSIHA